MTDNISLIKLLSLSKTDFYVTKNGKIVDDWSTLSNDSIFRVHLRVIGGKGGFGSLLRSFRIHRSSNQLMCRDLSGRRLGDVKEEEKLRKWIEKGAEREAEKEKKRKDRHEKLKNWAQNHKFDDQDYMREKEKILENTDDAFDQGIKNLNKKSLNEPGPSEIKLKRRITEQDEEEKSEKTEKFAKKQKIEENENECVIYSDEKTVNITEKELEIPQKLTKIQKKALYDAKKKQNEQLNSEMDLILIDLNSMDSIDKLTNLSIDHLKIELEIRGLKCGGSLKERAERLFMVRNLEKSQYPKSILAKKNS